MVNNIILSCSSTLANFLDCRIAAVGSNHFICTCSHRSSRSVAGVIASFGLNCDIHVTAHHDEFYVTTK